MKLLFALTVIMVGLMIATMIYREGRDMKRNEVKVCVESYTGRDMSFYDWEAAKKLSTEQIRKDVGVNENVITDCLNRW